MSYFSESISHSALLGVSLGLVRGLDIHIGLIDRWLKNIDDGKLTGVIFIDLSKNFDTVNHVVFFPPFSSFFLSPPPFFFLPSSLFPLSSPFFFSLFIQS
jgi:hypothetical protein